MERAVGDDRQPLAFQPPGQRCQQQTAELAQQRRGPSGSLAPRAAADHGMGLAHQPVDLRAGSQLEARQRVDGHQPDEAALGPQPVLEQHRLVVQQLALDLAEARRRRLDQCRIVRALPADRGAHRRELGERLADRQCRCGAAALRYGLVVALDDAVVEPLLHRPLPGQQLRRRIVTDLGSGLAEQIEQRARPGALADPEGRRRVVGVGKLPVELHQQLEIEGEVALGAGEVRQPQLIAERLEAQAFGDVQRLLSDHPRRFEPSLPALSDSDAQQRLGAAHRIADPLEDGQGPAVVLKSLDIVARAPMERAELQQQGGFGAWALVPGEQLEGLELAAARALVVAAGQQDGADGPEDHGLTARIPELPPQRERAFQDLERPLGLAQLEG